MYQSFFTLHHLFEFKKFQQKYKFEKISEEYVY